MFVGINRRLRYLWRAVDQHGNVLDVLVQSRRNAVAAKRFFRRLLEGLRYVSRVLVTDKLGSYQVANRELMSSVEHRRSRIRPFRRSGQHWSLITGGEATPRPPLPHSDAFGLCANTTRSNMQGYR